MTVWVIESGEYTNHGINGVADSLDAAIKFIKDKYRAPYIVEWSELHWDEYEGRPVDPHIVGKFQPVLHYSTEHTMRYDFSEYEVFGSQ